MNGLKLKLLAALLTALLFAALPALAEDAALPLPDDGAIAFEAADEMVPPATDAGETGLTVVTEDGEEIDLPGAGAAEEEPADILAGADGEPVEADPQPVVTGLGVEARTQEQIQAFVDSHPAYRSQINLYSVAAADDLYTVGRISPVNRQSALNMVNQVRYIAGLNADVTLLEDKEYDMAATALVLRLNGGLSHYPARPAQLADAAYDELYARGYAGAGSSNIAMGYTVTSEILAYMADADSRNMVTVGHRRWIINPLMGATAFGANGRFASMYAHDRTGAGRQTKVAWPAQETPIQYFSAGDPWSLSYGRVLDPAGVEVTLVRLRDGATWRFSQSSADGYFNVENSYYGRPGCVIFRPDGLDEFVEGERFEVSVADGANAEITRYTVRFFSLDLTAATPLDKLEVTAVKTDAGNEISWTRDRRATGYYVLRRTPSTLYSIVADVTSGHKFKDTAVTEGERYAYQVYAHTDSLTSASATGVEALPPAPKRVYLSESHTVKLYTNGLLKLTTTFKPAYAESTLTWKSSNERVAKVDENGLVLPAMSGTATITVTTANGKSDAVRVRVSDPPKPSSVELDATGTVKLALKTTLPLTAILSPAGAETRLTWSTSNKRVAKVSAKGVVTPVKVGTATITAMTANGKSASVRIKVLE